MFRNEAEARAELRRAKASRARHVRNREKYGRRPQALCMFLEVARLLLAWVFMRPPVFTLDSAKLLASCKWSAGTAGTVGYRIGLAVLRRKDIVKRYEVGYRTLVSVNPERWVERFLGNGASWGQAFAEAVAELETHG